MPGGRPSHWGAVIEAAGYPGFIDLFVAIIGNMQVVVRACGDNVVCEIPGCGSFAESLGSEEMNTRRTDQVEGSEA